jgi:methionyl-tRNA formyltransferase
MEEKNKPDISFIFFGTSHFSVLVLDELKKAGFLPKLIVTVPDKPKGRKLVMTAPETKVWAKGENVECIQPEKLKDLEIKEDFDVGIVASYGKIIPQNVLDIPKMGMLNVHPSLLPKLRGASPIQSAILTETETGVTIMKVDAEMDHGQIVAQEKVDIPDWPPYASDLENILGKAGGKLLADILPDYLAHNIALTEQDHEHATYTKKIEKEDGLLDLDSNAEENLRKIRAYHVWPTAYFFKDEKRIIVKKAHIADGKLTIDRIIPEGKTERDY